MDVLARMGRRQAWHCVLLRFGTERTNWGTFDDIVMNVGVDGFMSKVSFLSTERSSEAVSSEAGSQLLLDLSLLGHW